MNSKKDNGITKEDIDGRIDEIFGFDGLSEDSGVQGEPVPEVLDPAPPKVDSPEVETKKTTPDAEISRAEEESAMEQDSPELMLSFPGDSGSDLEKLNAIVLSMDWEIDDQVMDSFIREVGKLKELYKNDKFIFPLLQIHTSVGKYISAKKAKAHPESIKLLNSVFRSLEEVLGNTSMDDSDKTRLIMAEVHKLKTLKSTIKGGNRQVKTEEPVAVRESAPDNELVRAVVEEIKKELIPVIREEFAKLKREMGR